MGNITFYVHDLRTSGVLRDTMMVAQHTAERHDTTVVAGHGDGFFREEAERGGYRLEILRPSARGIAPKLGAVPSLRHWLRRQPPGVLVSMGNLGHATPWLAARGLDHVSRIYRISNEVSRGDGLRGVMRALWMGLLVADAARIALVGSALRRYPLFGRALEAGRAVEVASGVDCQRANALARAPSPHGWFGEDIPVVLGIGRLRPQKNFDVLIDAVGRIARLRPIRLIIVGGGTQAERARLERLVASAGLAGNFLLAGETDNVFAWAARAAVFALPSRWEGSSLALLEALAVGTPVVASVLAGDAADVLGHGRYGLLFDGDDAGALAAAIMIQMSDRAVRPGDRALDYGLTFKDYAELIDDVLRPTPGQGIAVPA